MENDKLINNVQVSDCEVLHLKLDLALQSADLGIWDWDISKNKITYSRQCFEMLGVTFDENADFYKEWVNRIHPEDRKKVFAVFKSVIKGTIQDIFFEHRMLYAHNEYKWLVGRGKIIKYNESGKPTFVIGTIQDISKPKNTENELKEITKQFDSFLDLTPSAIFAVDCNQKITRWNKRASEITGFSLEEVIGKECYLFADHPCTDTCGLFSNSVKKPIIGRECTIKRKDGKRLYVLKNANILYNSEGEMIGGIESFDDISNIKKIQNELIQSQLNLTTFFNTIGDMLFVLNENKEILIANDTAFNRLLIKPDDLIGQSFFELFDTANIDSVNEYFGKGLQQNLKSYSLSLKNRNNELIPIEMRISQGSWNNKSAYFIILEDLSEIYKSEAKFSKAFYLNASGMALTDATGNFIEVNESFIKLSEYSKEELLGKKISELKLYADEEHFASLREFLFSQKSIYNEEVSFLSKYGKIHHGLFSADFIEVQQQSYILMVFNDHTQIKEAEKQALTYLEALKRSNQDLEQFAYIASHDLQEPLRKILEFSERIKKVYVDSFDEKGLDYFERMQSAAYRMQSMINDLLSFSRITTKAKESELIDLNEIFKQSLSDLEVLIDKSHGKVVSENLMKIHADEAQMHQLFNNLIGNALKYRKDDEPPFVKVTCTQYDKYCYLVFKDNGIGIEKKYFDIIFKPFQRLHGRAKYEGSGIGLAICKKIVERHNGSISIDSTLGEGSSFIIMLPLFKK